MVAGAYHVLEGAAGGVSYGMEVAREFRDFVSSSSSAGFQRVERGFNEAFDNMECCWASTVENQVVNIRADGVERTR